MIGLKYLNWKNELIKEELKVYYYILKFLNKYKFYCFNLFLKKYISFVFKQILFSNN